MTHADVAADQHAHPAAGGGAAEGGAQPQTGRGAERAINGPQTAAQMVESQADGVGAGVETVGYDETDKTLHDQGYTDDRGEFADAIVAAFTKADLPTDGRCQQLWGALANTLWAHDESKMIGAVSFRTAGSLIEMILHDGDDPEAFGYMKWYCSHPYSCGHQWVKDALAKHGWRLAHAEEPEGCTEGESS